MIANATHLIATEAVILGSKALEVTESKIKSVHHYQFQFQFRGHLADVQICSDELGEWTRKQKIIDIVNSEPESIAEDPKVRAAHAKYRCLVFNSITSACLTRKGQQYGTLSFNFLDKYYEQTLTELELKALEKVDTKKLNAINAIASGYEVSEIKGEGYKVTTPLGAVRYVAMGFCYCDEYKRSRNPEGCIHTKLAEAYSQHRSELFDLYSEIKSAKLSAF